MPDVSQQDFLVIQMTVALSAIEALIATHPNPARVRRSFDQVYGQFQALALTSGVAHPDHLAVARPLVEKLFAPPGTP